MTNDSFPFPSPSKAPDTVTETDDTINPILMSLSASLPSRIKLVCGGLGALPA